MTFHDSVRASWRCWLGGALLMALPLCGWAQADPPGRVAYIGVLEGSAQVAGDGGAFTPASLNWPITTGTRVVVDPGTRIELLGGTTTWRANGPVDLSVTRLDDATAQLALTEGTLSLHIRDLATGERAEIDTPQLAMVANQPGEYRLDVDPRGASTRLTVYAGSATVYGEAGQRLTAGVGQSLQFVGRDLAVAQAEPASRDAFDQWVASRNAVQERSVSARYLPRELPGYQQLDAYGEWADDATYGPVWYPTVTVADWAPYRYGRWTWVEPWGWTWVDDAPWGFAPSHYGRWAHIGRRWAWVPGTFGQRPIYAPALVGFVGGASGNVSWGVSLASGSPAAAWFPLAPGEYWTPHYHASDRYRQRLNWGDRRERSGPPPGGFHFQRRPGAISVAPSDQFAGHGPGGRRPHFGDGSRLPHGALADGRLVAPPPRSFAPREPTVAPPPGIHRPPGMASQPGHDPRASWQDRDRSGATPLAPPATWSAPPAGQPRAPRPERGWNPAGPGNATPTPPVGADGPQTPPRGPRPGYATHPGMQGNVPGSAPGQPPAGATGSAPTRPPRAERPHQRDAAGPMPGEPSSVTRPSWSPSPNASPRAPAIRDDEARAQRRGWGSQQPPTFETPKQPRVQPPATMHVPPSPSLDRARAEPPMRPMQSRPAAYPEARTPFVQQNPAVRAAPPPAVHPTRPETRFMPSEGRSAPAHGKERSRPEEGARSPRQGWDR